MNHILFVLLTWHITNNRPCLCHSTVCNLWTSLSVVKYQRRTKST